MIYNPWHGCHKISAGCLNCYMFRTDARFGKDSNQVMKTTDFDLPLRKDKKGHYKVPTGTLLFTCFTSDFFIEEADEWRRDVWHMMKLRPDVHFFIITKRIHRFNDCIPQDWEEGYMNVTIACTVENQKEADTRLPIYQKAKIQHKVLILEPLLEAIHLEPYLNFTIERILVGGESGNEARACHYEWVLDLQQQAIAHKIPFEFRQTGAHFVKDQKTYHIPRHAQRSQAKKAHLDT